MIGVILSITIGTTVGSVCFACGVPLLIAFGVGAGAFALVGTGYAIANMVRDIGNAQIDEEKKRKREERAADVELNDCESIEIAQNEEKLSNSKESSYKMDIALARQNELDVRQSALEAKQNTLSMQMTQTQEDLDIAKRTCNENHLILQQECRPRALEQRSQGGNILNHGEQIITSHSTQAPMLNTSSTYSITGSQAPRTDLQHKPSLQGQGTNFQYGGSIQTQGSITPLTYPHTQNVNFPLNAPSFPSNPNIQAYPSGNNRRDIQYPQFLPTRQISNARDLLSNTISSSKGKTNQCPPNQGTLVASNGIFSGNTATSPNSTSSSLHSHQDKKEVARRERRGEAFKTPTMNS